MSPIEWLKSLKSNPPPWQGIVVCLCGFLLQLSLGAIFSYGNLTTYMTSYMRARVDPSINYAQLMWAAAALSFFEGLTMSVGSWMIIKIGPRATAFIGCAMVTSSVSLCYFAVQKAVWLVVLLFGFFNGLGVGIAYAVPLVCGMSWFPTSRGTANGFIIGGFGMGAFVFNSIQTAFLNPENVSPDKDGYFKDEALLDRVPYVFLLTGGIYSAMQFIAILGMMMKPVPKEEEAENVVLNDRGDVPEKSESSAEMESPACDSPQTQMLEEGGATDYHRSMNVRQALKTFPFWLLFFTYLFNNLCIGFINPLWKTFGQKFIDDDLFLSMVGSAASVFNLLGRLGWGMVNDRFGYRTAMFGIAGMLVTTFATLYLTSYAGKAMFFIWVCLIYMSFPGTFSSIPSEVAHVYGLEHAGVIYGVIWLSGGLIAPIPVFLTALLLERFGYLALFLTSAAFPTISFLSTFLFNGEKMRHRRLQMASPARKEESSTNL